MELIHYSKNPIGKILAKKQGDSTFKPEGLWVSVKGDGDWPEWCKGEEFGLDRLTCRTRIELRSGNNVPIISTISELFELTASYSDPPDGFPVRTSMYIDWTAFARKHDGLIIAPYLWDARLDIGCSWYYGWDCASGCIWNPDSIAEAIPI